MAIPRITLTIRVPAGTYDLLVEAARVERSHMNSIAEDAILRTSKRILAAHAKKSSSENVNGIKHNSEIPPEA